MFVSGFTFIRNAIKLDYAVAEAIRSILPLVDEMVVAVGDSEDETKSLIQSLGPKIKIIDTVWDQELRQGGEVLAIETNKALDAVNPKADWCFYIQGDECVHEEDHERIRSAMKAECDNDEVQGLLFDYLHFYGSYDYLGDSRRWYRKEVRIIKNLRAMRSYRDAQGFRFNGQKLQVKAIDARIYHYGWVRHPSYQMAKQREAKKLWHSDEFIAKKLSSADAFDYSLVDSVRPFEGTHPKYYHERIQRMNWEFDRDPSVKKFNTKQRFHYYMEKWFNWRIGEYKNYREI